MARKPYPYPSDVTDEERALVAPYLTLKREGAPQREHSLRDIDGVVPIGPPLTRDFAGPKGRKQSFMKDPGRRKRHRPKEVVAEFRQVDEALAAMKPIAKVARSLGLSAVTLHRWRAEYGAVAPDAVRRMKAPDILILKEVAKGVVLSPPRRRRAWTGRLLCTDSHKGWTDESDPVTRSTGHSVRY